MKKVKFSKINQRYIGAFIVVPIIISLIFGGYLLSGLIFILTLISLFEFSNSLSYKQINVNKYLMFMFTIIYYLFDFKNVLFLLFLFFILLLISVLDGKTNIIDISLSFVTVFYIIIPLSLILILSRENKYLPWIIFLSAWSTDTMAYFVGKKFGKNKIKKISHISPNKTLEGFIGGEISCIIVIMIYGFLFQNKLNISFIMLVFLGIITGVIGQIGDLVASSIKRFTGIKDFGNLIPGHGGVLDRFDSILMISVVVFLFSQILM